MLTKAEKQKFASIMIKVKKEHGVPQVIKPKKESRKA